MKIVAGEIDTIILPECTIATLKNIILNSKNTKMMQILFKKFYQWLLLRGKKDKR